MTYIHKLRIESVDERITLVCFVSFFEEYKTVLDDEISFLKKNLFSIPTHTAGRYTSATNSFVSIEKVLLTLI